MKTPSFKIILLVLILVVSNILLVTIEKKPKFIINSDGTYTSKQTKDYKWEYIKDRLFSGKGEGEYVYKLNPLVPNAPILISLNSATKQDSLAVNEIIDELSRYNIFSEEKKGKSFLNENVYLSLSGDLSNSVRFTSLFLIINYIYNTFMNMESTPTENGYRGMRYVLLIDEAHVIFKEKKYQEILDKILREIRSKGVAVVLVSQGIAEFNQPGFDFSSNCEMSFLLNIKDKTNSKSINKFLGFSDKEGITAARSLEKIESGQAISNIKEFDKAKLFKLSQFYENK